MDLATETGTYGLDDLSLTFFFFFFFSQSWPATTKPSSRTPKHPFNVKLNTQLKKAADLEEGRVRAVLRVRRPRCSLRLPDGARASEHCGRRLEARRDRRSRVPRTGASPRSNRLETGKSIIAGKTVTGFTIEGEIVLKVWDKLKSDKVPPVVEAVNNAGADYSSPMHPFDDYSITVGRLNHWSPIPPVHAAERERAFEGVQWSS